MKKATILFFILVIILSCNQEVCQKDLAKINGYWEIKKVILPDGGRKEYKINESIDYFEINNKSGFRKKVMPQFNGKYRVNDQAEQISILENEGIFYLQYKTPYGKWREEILEITDENLVLKNQQDLEYHYKRPTPFSIK